MSNLYELSHVVKTYSKGRGEKITALSDVNLVIQSGEHIAIQGPTGGGKSTLLQMLGALDRPTSGEVIFDGDDLAKKSDGSLSSVRAKSIGFVFQNYNLVPTLSALENVEASLAPLGMSKKTRESSALEVLNAVGLSERIHHLPAELSGGQQQRVAIARAMVKKPRVILADEPTGNLDEATRDEIMDLLEKLRVDEGITLIIVTHDTSVAKRVQRRLKIHNGVVTEVK
jgi:putative ABC transport system ATP-binding protein